MSIATLKGTLEAGPGSTGLPTSDPITIFQVCESNALVIDPLIGEITLTDDNPKAINFGSLVSASWVYLHATGGKVRARLTSTDGAQQAVGVDPHFENISLSMPYTALDLTRAAGSGNVSVKFFLGQAAT